MISKTAVISDKATLGRNVHIGEYTIIKDNVVIDDDSIIKDFCVIGEEVYKNNSSNPLVIGKNAFIRSHSVIYQCSSIGINFTCGHNVHIRENTKIGNNCQIGSNSEIQGDVFIGNFTRTQSNVFISKFSYVDNYVWLLPYVSLLNDRTPPSDNLVGPKIMEFAVISANCTIMPDVTIGNNSVIGANSLVDKNVESGFLYYGSPAKKIKKIQEVLYNEIPAYPWKDRFKRGY